MPKAPARGAATQPHIPLVQTRPTPAKQVRVTNRRSTSVATITGQRASSPLPDRDTPRDARRFSPRHDGLPHADQTAQSARAAWRSVAPWLAGTPHVRVSRDGGRTFPARSLPSLPASRPRWLSTIPLREPVGCWRSTWTRPRPRPRCPCGAGQCPGGGARAAALASWRPVRRRRVSVRRPPRVRPVRRSAALARAARR